MERLHSDTQALDERFVIDDDIKADWAVRKIATARAERDRLIDHFARQIEKANEECANTENAMTALLYEYLDTVPSKQTKTQRSYKLPSGTIRLKTQQPDYQRDAATLAKWLVDNGHSQYVKEVPTPMWAELKPLTSAVGETAVIADTGEVIEGIKVVARPPKFEVEV